MLSSTIVSLASSMIRLYMTFRVLLSDVQVTFLETEALRTECIVRPTCQSTQRPESLLPRYPPPASSPRSTSRTPPAPNHPEPSGQSGPSGSANWRSGQIASPRSALRPPSRPSARPSSFRRVTPAPPSPKAGVGFASGDQVSGRMLEETGDIW